MSENKLPSDTEILKVIAAGKAGRPKLDSGRVRTDTDIRNTLKAKKWNDKNKESICKYHKEYYIKNQDIIKEKIREYKMLYAEQIDIRKLKTNYAKLKKYCESIGITVEEELLKI